MFFFRKKKTSIGKKSLFIRPIKDLNGSNRVNENQLANAQFGANTWIFMTRPRVLIRR